MKSLWFTSSLPVVLVLVTVLALLGVGCGEKAASDLKYHCPMHPTYVSDRPGDCPICGMRLTAIERTGDPATTPACVCPFHHDVTSDTPERCPKCGMKMIPNAECGPACAAATAATDATNTTATAAPRSSPVRPAAAPGERKLLFYRNPMDPAVTSKVPAKDQMGMEYVPVYSDEVTASGGVKGLAPVELSATSLRLAGVQTAVARRESLVRTVRTAGIVAADEARVRHVHTRIRGWIEKLSVNFTGQEVRKGEPLLTLYSPELLASQEEFLRVRAASARLQTSALPEVRKGGEDLLAAARRRLQLFDVPESFVVALERRGTPLKSVPILAPVSGFVTAKSISEGQQVEPGQELYTVTDLSRVWIEADVYEQEAPFIRVGQEATVSLQGDAGNRLSGRVTYVVPFLNPETRTLKARLEFDNPGLRLKPGMYADVELTLEASEGVVVPDAAVLDTGTRKILFVETAPGHFEPREARTGIRRGGKVEIVSGLSQGERVAVHANFLLDSESQLRAAIGRAAAGSEGAP